MKSRLWFIACFLTASVFVGMYFVGFGPREYLVTKVSGNPVPIKFNSILVSQAIDLKPITQAIGLGEFVQEEFRPQAESKVKDVFLIRSFNKGKVFWLYKEIGESGRLKKVFSSEAFADCKVRDTIDQAGIAELVPWRTAIFLVLTNDKKLHQLSMSKLEGDCAGLISNSVSASLSGQNFQLTYILTK